MLKPSLYWSILLAFLMAFTLVGCTNRLPSKQKMPSMAEHEIETGTGCSQEYHWQLMNPVTPYQAGKPITLTFLITDPKTKKPIQDFKETHNKLFHLILVSRDLTVFQHLHPQVVAPGKLSAQTQLPKEGQYILYLEFATTQKGEQTIKQSLQVGHQQTALARLVPDADQIKIMDGYTFQLSNFPTQANVSAEPSITIQKEGKPVTNIEPYLGAGGHAVIISQDTESFLHVHPMTQPTAGGTYRSPITFHTQIPKAGAYKMWAQFKMEGKVETVSFTFQVQ